MTEEHKGGCLKPFSSICWFLLFILFIYFLSLLTIWRGYRNSCRPICSHMWGEGRKEGWGIKPLRFPTFSVPESSRLAWPLTKILARTLGGQPTARYRPAHVSWRRGQQVVNRWSMWWDGGADVGGSFQLSKALPSKPRVLCMDIPESGELLAQFISDPTTINFVISTRAFYLMFHREN